MDKDYFENISTKGSKRSIAETLINAFSDGEFLRDLIARNVCGGWSVTGNNVKSITRHFDSGSTHIIFSDGSSLFLETTSNKEQRDV